MIFIGVTGGVGAGKSEILTYLKQKYEAEIILADEVGRELMEPDGACFQAVVDLFGSTVVKEDGTLDRPAIAEAIYLSSIQRIALNQIIHPAVRKRVLELAEDARNRNVPILILEAALLIEENYNEICDELWYVYTDDAVRTKRLMETRHYSEEKIRQMMATQLPEEEFRRHCDFVLDNSGSFYQTASQIDQRMKQYEIL